MKQSALPYVLQSVPGRTAFRVRDGQGAHEPVGCGHAWEIRSEVVAKSEEQSRAVHALLESKDLVTTLHGPTGSGKPTLSREIVAAIGTLSGNSVIMLAPSSSAVGSAQIRKILQRFQADELLQSCRRSNQNQPVGVESKPATFIL